MEQYKKSLIYEYVTGKTMSYGVFAVSQQRLGNNSIFGENGEVAQGVLSYDVTVHSFDAFELKITGFNTEEQMAAKLAFGAYVVASDGEESIYSYIQTEAPLEGEKYYFVSYNEIVNA